MHVAELTLNPEYGGQWHWKGGHPDTTVMVHVSAVDGYRPKGTAISSPGGWYDAGDFGKYVVNSGITTYTLLLSNQIESELSSKAGVEYSRVRQ